MIAPSPKPQHGFTILEIMVVVTVIGILSFLALVATARIRERSARSMIQNNLRQFYQAKEFYFFEKGVADATSILVIERQGYARSSLKNALLSPRSLEANMGWHYMTDANPNEPTYAYRGVKPPGQAPTGEVIYYPGPPGSPALAAGQAGSKPGNPGANPSVVTVGGVRPGFSDMTDMTGVQGGNKPVNTIVVATAAQPSFAGGEASKLQALVMNLGSANQGALLRFKLNIDPARPTTSAQITGLPAGTVVSDGSRTFTSTGIADHIDVQGWNLETLSAQLPSSARNLVRLELNTTAMDANGQSVSTTSNAVARVALP